MKSNSDKVLNPAPCTLQLYEMLLIITLFIILYFFLSDNSGILF